MLRSTRVRGCRATAFVRALIAAFTACVAAVAAGCASHVGTASYAVPTYLDGRNYAYAVYDGDDALIHGPIEHLHREILKRSGPGAKPISDIYVIAHGWNYTIDESFKLYEGYRHALDEKIVEFQREDPRFEPYFVFVVWSSVSRPLSDAVKSVWPWTRPEWGDRTAEGVDAIAFHMPSSWGESQGAEHIALGPPRRRFVLDPGDAWQPFDVRGIGTAALEHVRNEAARKDDAWRRAAGWPARRGPVSEYQLAVELGVERARETGFRGFQAPVSVLLDELVTIRDGLRVSQPADVGGPRLHVVGHSFGGKLAALAVHDVAQRRLVREATADTADAADASAAPAPDIDTLVVLLPAMQVSEMFSQLDLSSIEPAHAERMRTLAASPGGPLLQDLSSVFGDGPLVLRYEPVARRIGAKILVHSRHDSANGWLFALGDFLLDHDAITHSRGLGHDRTTFESAWTFSLESLWQTPLDLGYATLDMAAQVGVAVYSTLTADVLSAGSGSIASFAQDEGVDAEDRAPWTNAAAGTLALPFSPIAAHRSIGNQGLQRADLGAPGSANWLDRDCNAYLGSHIVRKARAFDRASLPPTHPWGEVRWARDPGQGKDGAAPTIDDPEKLAQEDAGAWITYDARRVYNGAVASWGSFGRFLNLFPPGAHGDIRSTDRPVEDECDRCAHLECADSADAARSHACCGASPRVEGAEPVECRRCAGTKPPAPGEGKSAAEAPPCDCNLTKRDRTFYFVFNVTRGAVRRAAVPAPQPEPAPVVVPAPAASAE